jgi:hypothetical protein
MSGCTVRADNPLRGQSIMPGGYAISALTLSRSVTTFTSALI